MADLVSGHLAVKVLAGAGVEHVFTLSGAHIFPLYDGARHEGIRLVDTRHEQTAAFAAEGLAKLTRRPQVAAVTAGPGVTNTISAVATAQSTGSPLVVIGGRAPQATWGAGSLQEIDHVPVLAPLTKLARTSFSPEAVASDVDEALRVAATPHRGPTFVDLPMDVVFTPGPEDSVPAWVPPDPQPADPDAVAAAARALRRAERPVLVAGTDVWFGGAWEALRDLAETVRVPVVTNGMGRGCLPADHDLAISRARGAAFRDADLVVVVGTPLDFRLGYGHFGDAAVVHVVDHPDLTPDPVPEGRHVVAGDLAAVLQGAAAATEGSSAGHEPWIDRLRAVEAAKRAEEPALLEADTDPIHPARVYGALRQVLDRDAVVVGDGGDFVSFAGKYIDSHLPGHWLDPGPYGCLGTGMGYAAAARLAHPDRQVLVLLGDGAAGFSLMDVDTLVRHGLPVVMVVGNNGIWALEKHPMRMLYDGWDAVADLRQATAYDRVVEALGGAGETVRKGADLQPALERAFASGVPYLVNVLTDPEVAYPRSAAL